MWNIQGISVRGKSGRVGFSGDVHKWPSEHLNLEPFEVDFLSDPENVTRMILQRLGEAFGFDDSPFL
jgi:hypothetical protein